MRAWTVCLLALAACSARAQAPQDAAPATTAPAVAGGTGPATEPSGDDLSFSPPLSVEEAIALIQRAEALLKVSADAQSDARRKAATRMVTFARDYCQLLDDRHSSLGAYSWLTLAEIKAPTGGLDTKTVRLPIIVANVSALSFIARRGDVSVWSVKVIDNKGKEEIFELTRVIGQDLPMTVIRYLRQPTDIETIEARCGTTGKQANLVIYAGITNRPEYAKKAVRAMDEALTAINDKRDGEATEALGQARAGMSDFRRHIEGGAGRTR